MYFYWWATGAMFILSFVRIVALHVVNWWQDHLAVQLAASATQMMEVTALMAWQYLYISAPASVCCLTLPKFAPKVWHCPLLWRCSIGPYTSPTLSAVKAVCGIVDLQVRSHLLWLFVMAVCCHLPCGGSWALQQPSILSQLTEEHSSQPHSYNIF